ncbi:hypothetical protein F5Y18DRAFT_427969 [Xylariaceae sp. FL1019]|nr:hypothetical protein F5Y18DRAFT_427969 [Xylariaceae sp. FL1019]
MAVYHIVLFKLKPGVKQEQVDNWCAKGGEMVGQIPGLVKFSAGAPLPITAARAQGYDLGVTAILEKPDDIMVFATHPAHNELSKLREGMTDEVLCFDLEF